MLSLTLCSVNDHNNKKPDYVRMIDKMSSGSVSYMYLSLSASSKYKSEASPSKQNYQYWTIICHVNFLWHC